MSPRWVFGYGSLVYEPEGPDWIEETRVGWLEGHSRRLNKVSWARGCDESEAAGAAIEGWFDGSRRLSLAFGTVPGGSMEGRLVRYAEAGWSRVLAGLQRREGCRPDVPASSHHYRPVLVPVQTALGTLEALTFLSIPTGPHHRELDDVTVAAVLGHATPAGAYEGKRRGRHYADALLEALTAADPWLEGVLARVDQKVEKS